MATVHAAQALFVAKQMVPCAIARVEFFTALSEHRSVCDYLYPLIGV